MADEMARDVHLRVNPASGRQFGALDENWDMNWIKPLRRSELYINHTPLERCRSLNKILAGHVDDDGNHEDDADWPTTSTVMV